MPELLPPAGPFEAAAAAAVPASWPLQLSTDLSSLQLLPYSAAQPYAPASLLPHEQQQQQQLFNLQQNVFAAAGPSASQLAQALDNLQQQQQQPAAAVSSVQAFGSPTTLPVAQDTQQLVLTAPAAPAASPVAPAAAAVVQFAQPDEVLAPSFQHSSSTGSFPAAPCAASWAQKHGMQQQQQQQQHPTGGLAAAQTKHAPAVVRTDEHSQQQQQQQQQHHEQPLARGAASSSNRSALSPALAAAALQQQQQQQKPEGTTADWARSVAEACNLTPMSLGATPVMGLGFGPMSLSTGFNLQEMGMGGVGSLTEADVAAMWADEEDQLHDAELADALLRQGLWSFEQ
jgi:hypothetical protein